MPSQCAVCDKPAEGKCDQACVTEKLRRNARKATRVSQLKRAQEKVASLSKELGHDAFVQQLVDAEARFERDAADNADNVTLHRLNQFLDSLGPDLEEMVGRFCYTKGYTAFDATEIVRKMRGAPRPIMIEPERPSFFDEDEES
jgi:hypothetical protein